MSEKPKSRQEARNLVEMMINRETNYKKVICDLHDQNKILEDVINELETKIRWNLGVILINVIIILCCFLIMIN